MTPTDILGDIKLYNADCMEVMKTFKDKQFNLAIIDSPYGIGEDGARIIQGVRLRLARVTNPIWAMTKNLHQKGFSMNL